MLRHFKSLLRHFNFLASLSVKDKKSLIAGFGKKHGLNSCKEFYGMKLSKCANHKKFFGNMLNMYKAGF